MPHFQKLKIRFGVVKQDYEQGAPIEQKNPANFWNPVVS